MAYHLPPDQVKSLMGFIELCKAYPDLLHHPDLNFFKKYIESFGVVIPPKKESSDDENKSQKKDDKIEPEVEEESEESEVELDYEGVIEPDNDPPQTMGYTDQEVSEEDMDKSDEKKREAIQLYSEQKYEEAINSYTEAILLNPTSALLYAKRGQCYIQLNKPNACIRDCTRALEINPDNAAAYKFRGRAHRLLGNFAKAAEDLRNACKIDYDEQADEWLKEVTPNARKIEDHQRKYERKRLEKEVKETRERIRRMREEQQKLASETKEHRHESEDEGIDGGHGGGMGDFLNIMKDPAVLQAFQDPEVEAAFQDISQNPMNILKYRDNPKVSALLNAVKANFGGQKGGVFGKMPPNFGAGFGGANSEGPKKPPPSSDIDLD